MRDCEQSFIHSARGCECVSVCGRERERGRENKNRGLCFFCLHRVNARRRKRRGGEEEEEEKHGRVSTKTEKKFRVNLKLNRKSSRKCP